MKLLTFLRDEIDGVEGEVRVSKPAMARAVGSNDTNLTKAINRLVHIGHLEVLEITEGEAGGNLYRLTGRSEEQRNYENERYQARREVLRAASGVVGARLLGGFDLEASLDRLDAAVAAWDELR